MSIRVHERKSHALHQRKSCQQRLGLPKPTIAEVLRGSRDRQQIGLRRNYAGQQKVLAAWPLQTPGGFGFGRRQPCHPPGAPPGWSTRVFEVRSSGQALRRGTIRAPRPAIDYESMRSWFALLGPFQSSVSKPSIALILQCPSVSFTRLHDQFL